MKNLSEIRRLPFVKIVALFSPQLECVAWSFDASFQQSPYFENLIAVLINPSILSTLIGSLGSAGEVEFIYEKEKIFFRKAGKNILAVIMGKEGSTEMVRLASDILMPQLRKEVKAKEVAIFARDTLFRSISPKVQQEVENLFSEVKKKHPL